MRSRCETLSPFYQAPGRRVKVCHISAYGRADMQRTFNPCGFAHDVGSTPTARTKSPGVKSRAYFFT